MSSSRENPAPGATGLLLPLIGNIETVFADVGGAGAGISPSVVIRPSHLDRDLLVVRPAHRECDRARAGEFLDERAKIGVTGRRGGIPIIEEIDCGRAIWQGRRQGGGPRARQVAHPNAGELTVDDLQCRRLLARRFQHL